MKVILLTELKGKGGEGDVVDVANGFANNYLFPNKLAIAATSGNLKQLEQRKSNIAKRESDRVANAEDLKKTLEEIVLKVEAKVGEEGQLFGSVTTQMIVDALKASAGVELDKKSIDMKAAIKVAGQHEVTVALYRDTKATLKLNVGGAEEAVQAPEEAVAAEATEEEASTDSE